MKKHFKSSRGFAQPYGASRHTNGFNFALFSKHARAVSLCLFKPKDRVPICEIVLDPKINRTGDVWHLFVFDLPDTYCYGYRVDGPYDPLVGHTFDNRFILLDPYCKRIDSPTTWGEKTNSHTMCGYVYPIEPFDWQGDRHPNLAMQDLVIYEMHIRGFTQDPSSGVKQRGTFDGMIEKISHLKALGINAVELMPIYAFDETHNVFHNPNSNEPLWNYWGYAPQNFFSPMNRYGSPNENVITEFKKLVQALHEKGIEVILDVVYNHTEEGSQVGPTFSYKGLENQLYYMLGPNGEYYNFSGCGNTLNCNHPVVRNLIISSLRYWVTEMHIDGFRFDLASILVRSHDGIPLESPPLIEAISEDPILANTKLIAEPWDAAGLYQVGSFPGHQRWAEWNGKYRDHVRRFIKGTDGEIGHFATRIAGSEDLYGQGRTPTNSINFITAHDGFTLADLVSYQEKHNESNGENGRDGTNDNESWNCGEEGISEAPEILALREKQMRNFHLALMLSQGVPMLLMGDEYAHTKYGNNNTWGQDNRLNWFQWDILEKNREFFRFYRMMIAFRKSHTVLKKERFLTPKDIIWHGEKPKEPNWDKQSRLIAFSLPDKENNLTLYCAFNTSNHMCTVHLPKPQYGESWYAIVDTSLNSPSDIVEEKKAKPIKGATYKLPPFSALLLKAFIRNGAH